MVGSNPETRKLNTRKSSFNVESIKQLNEEVLLGHSRMFGHWPPFDVMPMKPIQPTRWVLTSA